jgi:hypothetical protein
VTDEPLNLHGIHESDMVGISGMENWVQDRSNRLVPTVVTVRQWFRMARASAWLSIVEWPEVTIRFSTGHSPYRGVEFDIGDLHDIRNLLDTPPVLQLPRYARIVGQEPSYESVVRMRELMKMMTGFTE